MQSNGNLKNKILSFVLCLFYLLGIIGLCWVIKGALREDRVCLDYGGDVYVEWSKWWGLKSGGYPLRVIGGEWHRRTNDGDWIPMMIEPVYGPESSSPRIMP